MAMTSQMLTMTSTISYANRRRRPLATLPAMGQARSTQRTKRRLSSLTIEFTGATVHLSLGTTAQKPALRLV